METATPPPEFLIGARVRVTRGTCAGRCGEVTDANWNLRSVKLDGEPRSLVMHVSQLETEPTQAESDLMTRLERGVEPPRFPLAPAVASIASGAALWQQADHRNRQVFIHIHGHVASVTATASPDADGHTAKFLGPVRESAVAPALDFVVANGDHKPFEFGGSVPLAEIGGVP